MSNTLFVGKVYHRFDELPSTNDWAAQLVAQVLPPSSPPQGAAKTKPPEGTVVRAANQTAGRGQLGSQWHSRPGENLLLSVIFYPTWLDAQAQFYLSMGVALAIKDTLVSIATNHSSLITNHSIKWPNDLYLNDKKTAGILIQNALSGSQLQSSIIGIGLNVNQLEFPSELPHATSLASIFGQKFDLEQVADLLFECLERRYLQLKAGESGGYKNGIRRASLAAGEPSRFVRCSDGSEFTGVILGVSDLGLLRLKTNASVEAFEVKQLRFVGWVS